MLTRSIAVILVAALLILQGFVTPSAGISNHQNPAPPLKWRDWQLVGSCGGVNFLASITVDDGRNDVELKLKIDNQNAHAIQTRLDAIVESAEGEKKSRDNVGTGRLNGKRAADACSTIPSLCFGVLFPSGILQKEPTGVAKITLTKVEVANIDAPPAHASPAKYLEPFRDFPTTRCRDLSISFVGGGTPAFVKLTDRCVKALPKWTKPDCDDAVDEIIKAYTRATTVADQNCIKEWRAYQQCYEIYAYDSNPYPGPSCQRPACKVSVVKRSVDGNN
ncbi:MAG TPA: hypothetical protein VN844_21810 [Pyrinomonadaceae bacterium]|nr:hypothetical protein [Pyrinomonadaceae bacterium]